MKATLAKLPADEDGWGFEIKWDGVRAIAYCEPGTSGSRVATCARSPASTRRSAGSAQAIGGDTVILDGELVAFDDDGRPSFQRLQRRMHVASDAEVRRRMGETPVTYVIFDLLYARRRGRCSISPYEERRERLEELGLDGDSWQTPAYHRGDGAAAARGDRSPGARGDRRQAPRQRLPAGQAQPRLAQGQERAQPGGRDRRLAAGQGPPRGRARRAAGRLLRRRRRCGYAGKVGTGFGAADLRLLRERLEPLRTDESPFEGRQPQKGSIFVEPELVAEVEFAEWTNTGTLRHASYEGLRDDKPATEVVREEPAGG